MPGSGLLTRVGGWGVVGGVLVLEKPPDFLNEFGEHCYPFFSVEDNREGNVFVCFG